MAGNILRDEKYAVLQYNFWLFDCIANSAIPFMFLILFLLHFKIYYRCLCTRFFLPIIFHVSLSNFMLSVFLVFIKISQPTLLMTDLHSFYIHVLVKVSADKLIINLLCLCRCKCAYNSFLFFLSKLTVAYDVKCSSAALSREIKRKIFLFLRLPSTQG